MISQKEYEDALTQVKEAQNVINQFHREKAQAFEERMKNNPVFTDDELKYSATNKCPCGYGLAYPLNCGPHHYWDCSAILKGIADPYVVHTGKLPFVFYDIKSESELRGTTRPDLEKK